MRDPTCCHSGASRMNGTLRRYGLEIIAADAVENPPASEWLDRLAGNPSSIVSWNRWRISLDRVRVACPRKRLLGWRQDIVHQRHEHVPVMEGRGPPGAAGNYSVWIPTKALVIAAFSSPPVNRDLFERSAVDRARIRLRFAALGPAGLARRGVWDSALLLPLHLRRGGGQPVSRSGGAERGLPAESRAVLGVRRAGVRQWSGRPSA